MAEYFANPVFHRYLIAAVFCGMGLLHFIKPSLFIRVMPDYIPFHKAMVLVSGFAEVAGGAGLLIPACRPMAAWGLVLLLFAVFPANIDMAVKAFSRHGLSMHTCLLLLRLPLQFVLMYWVYWAGVHHA